MTDALIAATNSLDVGEEVELYEIDFNPAGFPFILTFTPSDGEGKSIWFRDNEYMPRPIMVSGFEKSSDDAPPEPTLSLGNIDKLGNTLLKDYNDCLGAKVTRIVTYTRFLQKNDDGTANPTYDPYSMQLPEVWYVEQKVGNTPMVVTWRLRSVLDLYGKKVPARLVLKDVCMRAYRVWNGTSFSYAMKKACPYAGSAYFDRNGDATTDPSEDECSKDFKGCARRFPNEALPGWFFPGVSRLPR